MFLFIEEVLICSCILMDAREREKAWAADGAGSVTPAPLATGRLFCDHTPLLRPTQRVRGGRYGKAVAVHVRVLCLLLITLVT